MPRTRPPYPLEFRGAVRLVRTGGKLIREVADDLGVSEQTLRNWLRQADLDDGRRSDGLTSSEQEELRTLRRKVRVLDEDREILKKAAASSLGRPISGDELWPQGHLTTDDQRKAGRLGLRASSPSLMPPPSQRVSADTGRPTPVRLMSCLRR